MHSFRQTFLRSFNPSNNDVSQQSLLCSVISLSFPISTNYTFLRRLQRKSQVLPAGKKQFLICHIVSAELVSRVLVRQNRHWVNMLACLRRYSDDDFISLKQSFAYPTKVSTSSWWQTLIWFSNSRPVIHPAIFDFVQVLTCFLSSFRCDEGNNAKARHIWWLRWRWRGAGNPSTITDSNTSIQTKFQINSCNWDLRVV